jgi:uncharacterized protein (DUF427 family)
MPKAFWNNTVVADAPTDRVQIVEGNVYFPPDAVHREFLRASTSHTVCPWKGTASYYDVVVNGDVNRDAAWYYPQPKEAAQQIADHVAFWRGVRVEQEAANDSDRDSSATKEASGEIAPDQQTRKNDL